MRDSEFELLEKNLIGRSSPTITLVLTIAAALLLGSASFAELVYFRVAFNNVPGLEEIEAGDLEAGIKVLEDQLANIESERRCELLTTLCAAYIIDRSFDKAERACDKAMEINPTDAAYNNRGVVRAHKGDFAGAREDFDRVRPHRLDIYLEELWVKDVPLMAEENFGLVEELLAHGVVVEPERALISRGVEIEDLNH